MRFMRKSIFDEPINRLLKAMDREEPESDEYAQLLEHVDRLTSLREKERSKRVKPDTIWIVAGNIVGILAIVAYEQKHVMASRGMNFIMKPKQTD